MKNKVGRKDFASLIGVSRQYIDRLVSNGILTVDKSGLIDVEKGKQQIVAHSHPCHDGRRRSIIKSDKTNLDAQTLRALKKLNLELQTRLLLIQYEERMKELVKLSEVKEKVAAFDRQFREAFHKLPDKISDILAVTTNKTEVHRIMNDAIRDTLIEHAKNLK